MATEPTRRPLVAAGLLLGAGLGGFVDGIVLHQMLQVHNMPSARYPMVGVDAPTAVAHLEINMFWDGLFHAFTWLMTAAGVALLWRAARRPDVTRSTRVLVGALLLGWGLFNLVEGAVNHHLLDVHHVVEGAPHRGWDVLFLAAGAGLALGGLALIRAGRDPAATS